MKRRLIIIGLLLSAVLLPGLALALEDNYHVGKGDVLQVSVYEHPDLEKRVRVNGDGTIQFPLVGLLQVDGLTISEISDTISEALADGYIVNPQVSVFVQDFRGRKVLIMGQIKSPGQYELSGPTSLLELISKAGGLTDNSGDTAAIHRQRAGAEDEVLQIDLKGLLERGDRSLDIAVADGDNIFIAQAGMVYVTGEVGRPDSYKVDQGETLIMLVTRAGGFTGLASRGRVKVLRKDSDGSEQVFENVPMNMPLLPDDVVVVPESFF